jgi:hypothetical protein
MEFQNDNIDTRLIDALKEIEALKQALIKKGTITAQEVENEKP